MWKGVALEGLDLRKGTALGRARPSRSSEPSEGRGMRRARPEEGAALGRARPSARSPVKSASALKCWHIKGAPDGALAR